MLGGDTLFVWQGMHLRDPKSWTIATIAARNTHRTEVNPSQDQLARGIPMTVFLGLLFLAWCGLGLAGYGSALLSTDQYLRSLNLSIGFCASVGLTVYLALCGILESASLATPLLFSAFLTVGALLWFFQLAKSHRGRSQPAWSSVPTVHLLALLIALIAGIALIANSSDWLFGNPDDLQGYLVYVRRILQLGSTGVDPFSYRRFESGLGGGNYIYALSAAFGDSAKLRIIDIGGGLLMLASMIAADSRGLDRLTLALVMAMLVFAVAFVPSVNMTPEIVGMAMLYSMARLCQHLTEIHTPLLRAGLIGLFVFALTCLKTTFIVPAVSFAFATYVAVFLQERRWTIGYEILLSILVALVLMAPWMLVSEHAVGTPLFPLLGTGRLSPLEASGHPSLMDFIKSAGRLLLLLVLPVCVMVGAFRRSNWFLTIAIALCTFLLLVAESVYTVAGYRYGYAGTAALFFFSLVTWLGFGPSKAERRFLLLLAPLLLVDLSLYDVVAFGYGADTFRGGGIYRFFKPPDSVPVSSSTSVLRMQDSLPPGSTLLVRIDRPYLLDFSRNRVFVMDWPGMIGPDALVPNSSDGEVWKRYLRKFGIEFVAYSYRDEAGMSATYLRSQIAQSDSAFQRELMNRTLLTQSAFSALRESQRVTFDDGNTAVIDLGSPYPGSKYFH